MSTVLAPCNPPNTAPGSGSPRGHVLVWSNIYVLSTLLGFGATSPHNLRRTAVALRVRYTRRHAKETTRGPICASQGQAEAQEEQRRVPMPETAMQDLPRVYTSRVCAGLHVSVHSCAHASTH